MPRPKSARAAKDFYANLGFEAKLWFAADSRSVAETAEGNRSNNMDAAEYSRAERDRLPKAAQRADAAASVKHLVLGNISIYGQDKSARRKRRFGLPQGSRRASTRRRARQSNATTRRLAIMNLALRGIEADLVDCKVALPGQLFYSNN